MKPGCKNWERQLLYQMPKFQQKSQGIQRKRETAQSKEQNKFLESDSKETESSCWWLSRLRIQPVSMRIQVGSLASLSTLRSSITASCSIGCRCGSEMQLGSCVAVAVAQVGHSSNLISNLGNSICHRCGPKKKKKKKEAKIYELPYKKFEITILNMLNELKENTERQLKKIKKIMK